MQERLRGRLHRLHPHRPNDLHVQDRGLLLRRTVGALLRALLSLRHEQQLRPAVRREVRQVHAAPDVLPYPGRRHGELHPPICPPCHAVCARPCHAAPAPLYSSTPYGTTPSYEMTPRITTTPSRRPAGAGVVPHPTDYHYQVPALDVHDHLVRPAPPLPTQHLRFQPPYTGLPFSPDHNRHPAPPSPTHSYSYSYSYAPSHTGTCSTSASTRSSTCRGPQA